jgi:hypothetical protein
MKVRTGFVSNSSTSSFICDICGDVEAGYDLSLTDVEMHQCVNGHIYHDNCVDYKEPTDDEIFEAAKAWANEDENKKWYPDKCRIIQNSSSYNEFFDNYEKLGKNVDDFISNTLLSRYEVDELLCPFCRFEFVTDNDVSTYARKLAGIKTDKDGASQIKTKFANYKEFRKWLNEN